MRLFDRKNEEEEIGDEPSRRVVKSKLKDLKPENRKRRKEPVKPWGKKERLFIFSLLLITIVVSVLFSISSGNFEVPKLPSFNLDSIFKGKTVIVGDKKAAEKAARRIKAEEIISDFKDKTEDQKGIYAFEVIDLSDEFKFGVNQDVVMQAASLIKLPLMAYVQGKVDDSKLEAMGKRSDNNVFKELVTKFGKTTIQNYINSLGMENTSIEKNSTTSSEIGNIFLKLYKDRNEKILGYLTDTIFEKWLKAGVPEGIKVSHKYGREVGVVNDAGIIYSKSPFILVIMTQGVNELEADRLIPDLTKMIYSEYEENFK
jgi:beta-lactamase class A